MQPRPRVSRQFAVDDVAHQVALESPFRVAFQDPPTFEEGEVAPELPFALGRRPVRGLGRFEQREEVFVREIVAQNRSSIEHSPAGRRKLRQLLADGLLDAERRVFRGRPFEVPDRPGSIFEVEPLGLPEAQEVFLGQEGIAARRLVEPFDILVGDPHRAAHEHFQELAHFRFRQGLEPQASERRGVAKAFDEPVQGMIFHGRDFLRPVGGDDQGLNPPTEQRHDGAQDLDGVPVALDVLDDHHDMPAAGQPDEGAEQEVREPFDLFLRAARARRTDQVF